ncbi:MAG: hypothetical protein HY611_01020 [Elusimicrobia bacterium]|nr:hypothetical protein [Elusimicrobiota bacterium]
MKKWAYLFAMVAGLYHNPCAWGQPAEDEIKTPVIEEQQPAEQTQGVAERKAPNPKVIDKQQKAARQRFETDMKTERKAFLDGIKDLKGKERAGKMREFQKVQKERRQAFLTSQKEMRRDLLREPSENPQKPGEKKGAMRRRHMEKRSERREERIERSEERREHREVMREKHRDMRQPGANPPQRQTPPMTPRRGGGRPPGR